MAKMKRTTNKKVRSVIAMTTPVAITAAVTEGENKSPARFTAEIYTGVDLEIGGYDLPVVLDLAGMDEGKVLVANLDHDSTKRVGNFDLVNDGNQLTAVGIATAATAARDEVINSATDGYIWQASIEATPKSDLEKVKSGAKVKVNGRDFVGPIYVVRESSLTGFAFVSHGADDNTSVAIAAEAAQIEETIMNAELKKWILAMVPDTDIDAMSAEQVEWFEANFEGRSKPKKVVAKSTEEETLDTLLAKEKSNRIRISAITQLTAKAIQENPQHIEAIEALARLAIDGDWDQNRFELELLRATRPQSHTVFSSRSTKHQITGKVLEAAVCMAGKLPGFESEYDEQTLDTAHTKFRNGLGLKQLILMAAKANGYDGYDVTLEAQRAAFGQQGNASIQAGGFSTLSLSGILGNTANKFLLQGWNAVDSTWRAITAIRSVQDFKTSTSYSLTGGFEYEQVGPAGEIKHGEVGSESYTNKAETYGKMFAITRTDIINDDLGALTAVPRRLGRGAALKLNNIFWTIFLNNSSHFASGNSNVSVGAGSALGTANGAGLSAAEVIFMNQTDPDGYPLVIMPSILLVPPTLKQTAISYMNSGYYVGGGSTIPGENNWVGRFQVESSPYMENSNYTGYDAVAWYLLANPNDLATIETCFLNGREAPIVETADADFNTLGIQMRGYHDFGVSLQEPRAGVRSDTS